VMSYKDEYEVARLHLAPQFTKALDEQFGGSYRVKFHLAPPLLPLGKDRRGRPRKITLGAWMKGPFSLLARLKGLRGTAFDVFGYTAERKMERGLIGWYENLIKSIIANIGVLSAADLTEIAATALEIRGYGPIKEQAVKLARRRAFDLLSGRRSGDKSAIAGEFLHKELVA
jgi:indolepyruvate ferredoxin oxidoreductase